MQKTEVDKLLCRIESSSHLHDCMPCIMGAGRRRGGLVRAPQCGGLQEEEKSIDGMGDGSRPVAGGARVRRRLCAGAGMEAHLQRAGLEARRRLLATSDRRAGTRRLCAHSLEAA